MGRALHRCAVLSTATALIILSPIAWADSSGIRDYLPIAIEVGGPDSVIVEKGDHLWSISAHHLEHSLARSASDAEVTPYWRQVIEVNRDQLRSGDPDLIYPGETVLLPDVG